MRSTPTALLVLGLVSSAALASPQAGGGHLAQVSFPRLADSGPRGVVTTSYSARQYAALAAAHEREPVFVLRGVPLPGGLQADIELRPVSALETGARAQVVNADGSISLLESRARCFAGNVAGGGVAFLGLTPQQIHGYLSFGGELYFMASGGGGPGSATITHASQIGGMDPDFCGMVDLHERPVGDLGGVERLVSGPSLRTADVFFEADDQYRARFTSDQACFDYTVLLVTAASEIYRRDLGVHLSIPDRYLRIWNTTPPWGVITGFSHLANVYDWWQSSANPQRSLPRAAVHVLTHPIFGGTSRGIGGLCTTNRAYEISSLGGHFPYPIEHTNRDNWDLFVVCHELGHTFGSPHSFLYTPPIECVDGSGPDSGTIMSYCHLDYGMAKVGMRFHLREQMKIRSTITTAKCLRTQLLIPGDYDADGDVDEGDLAAAEGVLAQGFRSLGAEETFDMDGDGDFDAVDRDLLAGVVYNAPPASVLFRNGTGRNASCFSAAGNPVLGRTWVARIDAPGIGSSTVLSGCLEPTSVITARGELLVRIAQFGGTRLFTSTALSDGVSALHQLPLPLDKALFGLPIFFQGMVADGPSGAHYCNALDVVLSPYE